MLTGKEKLLLEALEPIAAEKGIEIVTVEVVGARKAPTIRVYIDTPDGVSFDELASAQEWINALMDDIDPFPGAYTLEVSSPGIDRPLRTPAHFDRFAGEEAQVVLRGPVNGRAKWTGTLLGMRDGSVALSVDGTEVAFPLDTIKRANVKGRIDFSQ
ncbi:ribosome maturation factor RimP [Hugonella massiliensis]|uniref:ribosome maturation factor RimP n=1 Tax=Hugonella massiliensis TaxID=1720315 RepID=UPI00073E6926|nr:ribosome maturation factor RimP [Hugonella massiliensis]MDD6730182.1 ribosome maturation factor RimP [Eggerthellaceae bacterium]